MPSQSGIPGEPGCLSYSGITGRQTNLPFGQQNDEGPPEPVATLRKFLPKPRKVA